MANITNLQRTKIWIDSSRWISLPNSAMPVILGGLTAFTNGFFDWSRFIIAFLGIIAVHAGTNLLDDYADLKIAGFFHRNKIRESKGEGIRTVKAPYVVNGTIRLQNVFYVSMALFAAGAAAGAYLTIVSGWPVIAIAAFGALICFFYSMPPVKLCYRGLGELVVGAAMGPGICVGTYYAVAQRFDWAPLFVGIVLGCLIGLILFVHSIMDYKPDIAVEKKTSVAYLGGAKAATSVLPVIFFIVYGIVVAGILFKILPLTYVLLFLTLPMAVKLVMMMRRLSRGDYGEEKPRWWMGPMEQKVEGHDWFMVRWLLARNVMITTTLLIVAANVIYAVYLIL